MMNTNGILHVRVCEKRLHLCMTVGLKPIDNRAVKIHNICLHRVSVLSTEYLLKYKQHRIKLSAG